MSTFLCKTCNKYRPIDQKTMVKKPNGLLQAKCHDCVNKTMQPTPVTYIKPNHPDYVGLTLAEAAEIKAKIAEQYGTIKSFCEQHKFIAPSSLSQLLRCERKIDPSDLAKIKAALGVV